MKPFAWLVMVLCAAVIACAPSPMPVTPSDGASADVLDAATDVPSVPIVVDPNAVPAPQSECTDAGTLTRPGDDTIAPPRPVLPFSMSRSTASRPQFQWILPQGTTGARIELCEDRCCTRVIGTLDAEGSAFRPTTPIRAGVTFWRLFGRQEGRTGSRPSATWEFWCPHQDAPNARSFGTIRSIDGDDKEDVAYLERDDGTVSLGFLLGSGRYIGSVGSTDFNLTGHYWADFNGDGNSEFFTSSYPIESPGAIVHHFTYRQDTIQVTSGLLGTSSCYPAGAQTIDINGDGYSDIAFDVSPNFRSPSCTQLGMFVHFGSSSGLAATAQIFRPAPNDDFRYCFGGLLLNVGDVDRDGYDDLVSMAEKPRDWVRSCLIHGGPSGEYQTEWLPMNPPIEISATSSLYFQQAGDFNDDGLPDWALGGPFPREYLSDTRTRSWNLTSTEYLYQGMPFVAWGNNTNISIGDVNGDGIVDQILANNQAATIRLSESLTADPGRVIILSGTSSDSPRYIHRSLPTPPNPDDRLYGYWFAAHALLVDLGQASLVTNDNRTGDNCFLSVFDPQAAWRCIPYWRSRTTVDSTALF